MESYRYGIIGAGKIGEVHAKEVVALAGAELVAVASRSEVKASALAKAMGCDYYTDYKALLLRDDIDIVIIATPNNSHGHIGIKAAQAGKHVIVEKPIDSDAIAAKELIAACRINHVKLTCVFQHRFDPAITALKAAIENQQLGKLTFGGCYTKGYRTQVYYDSSPGRGTWQVDGGGAVMMNGIHYIDALTYLLGPIEEVFAYCKTMAHEGIEVEDVASATVQFRNGMIGTIEASTAAFPGKHIRLEINGDEGSVIIENDHIKDWRLKTPEMAVKQFYGDLIDDGAFRDNGEAFERDFVDMHGKSRFQEIYVDFMGSIEQDRSPLITGESALHSSEVVQAIYKSSREHRPVKVDGIGIV